MHRPSAESRAKVSATIKVNRIKHLEEHNKSPAAAMTTTRAQHAAAALDDNTAECQRVLIGTEVIAHAKKCNKDRG